MPNFPPSLSPSLSPFFLIHISWRALKVWNCLKLIHFWIFSCRLKSLAPLPHNSAPIDCLSPNISQGCGECLLGETFSVRPSTVVRARASVPTHLSSPPGLRRPEFRYEAHHPNPSCALRNDVNGPEWLQQETHSAAVMAAEWWERPFFSETQLQIDVALVTMRGGWGGVAI